MTSTEPTNIPLTMSSLEIAGLCGKRHDNVLRDIRAMGTELGLSLSFEEKGETGGRPLTLVNLPKRETLILVSGYSTELRARIIDRWMQLEAAIGSGPSLPSETIEEIRRIFGINKMLSHKVTEIEKTIAELEKAKVAPTFDFVGTMTADQIIEAAGIKREDRVKGTAAMVTHRMTDFCEPHELVRTPVDLNPRRPWRFPRLKAHEWLFGSNLGAEQIRNQMARVRGLKARRRAVDQTSLRLVPPTA